MIGLNLVLPGGHPSPLLQKSPIDSRLLLLEGCVNLQAGISSTRKLLGSRIHPLLAQYISLPYERPR